MLFHAGAWFTYNILYCYNIYNNHQIYNFTVATSCTRVQIIVCDKRFVTNKNEKCTTNVAQKLGLQHAVQQIQHDHSVKKGPIQTVQKMTKKDFRSGNQIGYW